MLIFALNASYAHQALGALTLAAHINSTSPGACAVLECHINERDDELFYKLHQNAKGKKTVGFSCYIWNVEKMLKFARELKKLLPDICIIFGGPEVSYYDEAEFCRLYPFVDRLLTSVECEMWSVELYKNADNYHTVYYESSKGCPFCCSYCISGITNEKVRAKDVETVLDELKIIEEKYYNRENSKMNMIKFCDRSFNFDIKRANGIYRGLIERAGEYEKTYGKKLLPYQFEIYPTLFDGDSFEILKTAPKGLFQLEIGVQSLNQKTLQAVGRKNFDTGRALENIARIKGFGNIHVHADLIAGLPHEDLDSFMGGFDLLWEKTGADFIQIGFLKLLRGTKIREEAGLHGYIYEENPPYCVLANRYMGFEELAFLRDAEKIYKRYFSGSYKQSLDYVLGGGGVFAILGALARYWRENGLFERPISQKDAFLAFYKTFEFFGNTDKNILAGLLEGDYFGHEGKNLCILHK